MNKKLAIQLRGLTKSFGSLTAVDHVDLDVPDGQILALLGPNGAGKSTTTEMILGITQPDAGTISVYGSPPITAVRSGQVGAMLQNGALLADTSVKALLKMMHSIHRHPLPWDQVVEMADVGQILSSSTNKLSGGQAQRVRFALAIMPNPQLILLDEPTVGFDVDARRRFWEVMNELTSSGKTVVFATHYLEEADEFAHRIVVMNHGVLVADGSGSEIKARVGGKQVRFIGPTRDWSGLTGVLDVQRDGETYLLKTTDSDATLRALFTQPDADQISGVEITSPRLEDAFLSLVTEGAA